MDQKSAEVALNGVYYRFAEGGDDRGTPSTQWGYSQEIVPAYLSGYITRTSGGNLDENASVQATDGSVEGIWSYCYTLINAANGVISQMEPLPTSMFEGERKAEISQKLKSCVLTDIIIYSGISLNSTIRKASMELYYVTNLSRPRTLHNQEITWKTRIN